MYRRKRDPTELTEREGQIDKLVAEGYRSKEIARMLCIELSTVNRHRQHINQKYRALEGGNYDLRSNG